MQKIWKKSRDQKNHKIKFKLLKKCCLVSAIGLFFIGCSLDGDIFKMDETDIKSSADGKPWQNVRGSGDRDYSTILVDGIMRGLPDPEQMKHLWKAEKISELPDGTWQAQISFPYWRGYVDDTLALNDMYSFYAYSGQGVLYFSPDEFVDSFRLFVNGFEADVSGCDNGGIYKLDLSRISVNGKNTIQLSQLTTVDEEIPGTVEIWIPYPEVMSGTLEESGISKEAVDFISDLIKTDVEYGFPGAQLAVVQNGKLVYENAWGKTNRYFPDGTLNETSEDVTTETLYDLASVTKMFSVNYALQKLVTDGELDLDAKISDFLGAGFYKNVIKVNFTGGVNVSLDTQRTWKSEITIRDLLCHQGGFPSDPRYFAPYTTLKEPANLQSYRNPLYSGNDGTAKTKSATIEAICKTPLLYEPGTKTVYSDVDYMVLGLVVEKVTGKDLDTYLKETFFEPMGLTHITYNPLENGFTKENCAATELNGNTRDGAVSFPGIRKETIQGQVHDEKAYYNMGGISGHAGLFSNASDLARLASVMLTGGYGNHRFFSKNVMDQFMAPKRENASNWGLGWWREGDDQRVWYFGTQSGSDTVGHQGWTGTLVMIDPERDLVIVYLTNKINSPVTDKSSNPNKFDGNWFTSATLGFVPQILSMGMEGDRNITEQLKSLLSDMVRDSVKLVPEDAKESHPAVKNMESKKALLEKRAGMEEAQKESGQKKNEDEKSGQEDPDGNTGGSEDMTNVTDRTVILGDERFELYLPILEGKRVALFSNHTGIVGNQISGMHILDALIEKGVNVTAIFAPEHGFRGTADAGAIVEDSVDEKTQVPIFSLHGGAGSSYPDKESMDRFDILVIDIQDVGLRYYTYYISMYYLMDACVLDGKEVILLDRPNPNGFYVDGPILKDGFYSNVGRLPLPVVHGLTLGELALMINGEGWLTEGKDALKLKVIPCENYTHATKISLAVNPSPNLKDMRAIYLYASTCFFENTAVSVGRGTDYPFEIYGSPYFLELEDYNFSFVPQSMSGAENPPFLGEVCYGKDLRGILEETICEEKIQLNYLISAYNDMKKVHPEVSFFGKPDAKGRYWIDLLCGTDQVRLMIEEGKEAEEIKDSWKDDLEAFKKQRKPYLLYEYEGSK